MIDPEMERWNKEKKRLVKLPTLSCGCPNDGRPFYAHLYCDRIACEVHADDPHDCPGDPAVPPLEDAETATTGGWVPGDPKAHRRVQGTAESGYERLMAALDGQLAEPYQPRPPRYVGRARVPAPSGRLFGWWKR